MKRSITIVLLLICLVTVLIVWETVGYMHGMVERESAGRCMDEGFKVRDVRDSMLEAHRSKDDGEQHGTNHEGVVITGGVKIEEASISEVGKMWFCGKNGTPDAVKAIQTNEVLRVFGKGAMKDYDASDYRPSWRGPFNKNRDSTLTMLSDHPITNIIIEEGITHIGTLAFSWLYGLTSISIPASVSSIGKMAFYRSEDSLISLNVAAKNTRYTSRDGVLFNKKGDSLIWYPRNRPQDTYTIPNHVAMVGERAFYQCRHLKSVTIPSNVKAIGVGAFSESGLRSVMIENGVAAIGKFAFSSCIGLTSVRIPGSVVSTGYAMFSSCINLSTVAIEEGVTAVERRAFVGCTNLMSVTIPSSVTYIGDSSFFKCDNLVYVTILNPIPPNISENVFGHLSSDVCLYVPVGSVGTYRHANIWSRFECIKPIVGAVTAPIAISPPMAVAEIVADSPPPPAQTQSLGVRLSAQLRYWFGHRPFLGGSGDNGTDSHGTEGYRTVKIGEQVWMAENLSDDYRCYGNDKSNCKIYGTLYDWESAIGACPMGWHLPSRQEWKLLAGTTGDKMVAGKRLKSKVGWNDDDGKSGNGTDAFGFSAMPGGERRRDYYTAGGSSIAVRDAFYDIGYVGHWWSSDGYDKDLAYGQYMNNYIDGVHENYYKKNSGLSVRCVKDTSGASDRTRQR